MERIWNNLELFYYNVAKIAELIIKEAYEDKSHDIVFIFSFFSFFDNNWSHKTHIENLFVVVIGWLIR